MAQQRSTSSERPPQDRSGGDRRPASAKVDGARKRPPQSRTRPGTRRPPTASQRFGRNVRRRWARLRSWEREHDLVKRYGLVALVSAIALVPVLLAVGRHSVGGWVPDGDDAWVARRTMQVVSTSPPLIGQESTASDEPTESGLNHPGPVSYYVMAVPYAATGWSPIGLIIGAGFIVAVAMVCAVAMGHVVLGTRGVLGVGFALALLSVRLGQEWLVRPTSSALVVLPLGAGMLGLWAYLRGNRSGFFVALGLGTFAMQTSLVVLPMSGSLVAATVIAAIVFWVRDREVPLAGWSWLFAGALVVVWIPPLIDQFTRQPGNLADLIHYLYSDASGNKRTGKVTEALGFGPSAATVLDGLSNPFGWGGRRISGAAVWLVTPDKLGLVGPLLFGAFVVATVAYAWLRRRKAILALLTVAAVATVLAIISFARRPTETLFNSTYFVLWIQAVGLAWWSAIGIAAADAVSTWARDRRGRPPAGTKAAAREQRRLRTVQWAGVAVIAVLVAVASTASPSNTEVEAARVRGLSAQVRQNLPPGSGAFEVEGKGFVAWLSTGKGLGTDLIAHGYDARFTEWGGMVDEQLRQADARMPQVFVIAQEQGAMTEVPDDPSLLGSYRDDEVQLIALWVPGGDYANLCEQGTGLRASTDGLVLDETVAASADGLRQVLEQVSLTSISKDRNPEVRAAAKDLAQRRDGVIAQLSGGDLDLGAIPPEVVEDVTVLLRAYFEHCLVGPTAESTG